MQVLWYARASLLLRWARIVAGNETGMTTEERAQPGAWINGGMPD